MKKPYVLLIPCLLFTGCATNDHLTLKENERTFEYGEAVSADPADYLKETDKAYSLFFSGLAGLYHCQEAMSIAEKK